MATESLAVNIFPGLAEPERIWAELTDPELIRIGRKLMDGGRLDREDALACLASHDLLGLGRLALAAKAARFGSRAFYVVNHHVNYTNICRNQCRFCAFHRTPEAGDAYLLSPEQVAARVAAAQAMGLREVHLVGAVNPEPDFTYYLELLRSLKALDPALGLKAYTAVEIDFMARQTGLSWNQVLTALQEAGLSALPGGGAEIFSERVRQRLFPEKIDAPTWLGVHDAAHRLGIPSNATMLFGHIETPAEKADHLLRLREQQDRTGGFQAFIPLVFHPRNTQLSDLAGIGGVEILATLATSRLVLDNIPHIKAYWVMLGPKLAQTALHFGADDLEGTVVREEISHQAGATTSAGLTREQLEDLIREAGFTPAERDTYHQVV